MGGNDEHEMKEEKYDESGSQVEDVRGKREYGRDLTRLT